MILYQFVDKILIFVEQFAITLIILIIIVNIIIIIIIIIMVIIIMAIFIIMNKDEEVSTEELREEGSTRPSSDRLDLPLQPPYIRWERNATL